MARIELKDVNVTFSLRKTTKVTLKEYLLKGLFLTSVNPVVAIHALNNLSFTLNEGERLGVIGHNGAGKTTMLKMLAGVYAPNSGTRIVEGNICSLFDISVGFEGEANGWDNISYRGYLQGETPRTLKKKRQEIADFCELGDFLNIPVRYYSAGMLVRLAFAIATATEPAVLLVDEVLSVGDLAFVNKAKERMRQMMRKSSLMVLVSHDLSSVQEFCTRALWMEHGRVKLDGTPQEVVAAYQASIPATIEQPTAAIIPAGLGGPAAVAVG